MKSANNSESSAVLCGGQCPSVAVSEHTNALGFANVSLNKISAVPGLACIRNGSKQRINRKEPMLSHGHVGDLVSVVELFSCIDIRLHH